MKRWLQRRVTRGGLGYCVMGLIVLCGAAWSFGALVEIGNIATERARLTTLPPPYAGYLFAGSVDLFIFYGYLKCYGPPWQIVLAVFHILAGLVTSVWLQYQHSKGTVDPVLVSVIPPLAVAVSLDTWVVSQMVDWYQRSRIRPPWDPSAVPQPATVPASADPPSGPEHPVETRPKAAQGAPRRARPAALGRPTFTPTQLAQIKGWVAEGRTNKSQMIRELGWDIGSRQYKELGQLVNQLQAQPVQIGHPNGSGDAP